MSKAWLFYGAIKIQIHAIYQSMAQAQDIFGDRFHAMMANAHIKNFIGVNDSLTGQYISTVLGDKQDGTKFRTADELSRMRRGSQISFVRGERPILIENRPYYHRASMRRGVNKNPYHGRTPRLPALYPVMLMKGAVVALWAMSRPTPRQAVVVAVLGSSFFWWRAAWAMFLP